MRHLLIGEGVSLDGILGSRRWCFRPCDPHKPFLQRAFAPGKSPTCRIPCSAWCWAAVMSTGPGCWNGPSAVWQAGWVRQKGFVFSKLNSENWQADWGFSPIIITILTQWIDQTGLVQPDMWISMRQSRMGWGPVWMQRRHGDPGRWRSSRLKAEEQAGQSRGTAVPPGLGFTCSQGEGTGD